MVTTVMAEEGPAEAGSEKGAGGGGIGGGTGGGGNETVDLVCAVLGSEPAGDLGEAAITRMVKKVSGGRFQGTLAAAIIVEAVDLGCNEFVRSAVEATKSFLADHPDNIQLAKLGGYKVLDVEESIIALELSIDTADVRSLVDYICADLDGTRNSDPVKDLQAFVIDADLSDLNAVNGIVEQVISTCPSVVGPLEATEWCLRPTAARP